MRVVRRELGGVLNNEDAFALGDGSQKRGEQGGFAGTGAADDQEGNPLVHHRAQQRRNVFWHRAIVYELGQGGLRLAQYAQAQASPGHCGRAQQCVDAQHNTIGAGDAAIGKGLCIIEARA